VSAGYDIPFNRPSLIGTEQGFVRDAYENGHISGGGAFTERCEELLRAELHAPRVMLVTSCTHALEMCALLLEIRPGDEVIVPAYTFTSTANAFALRGARIVFADVRPDTLNIDERDLEALVTDRTKAIVVVHYAGVACDLQPIVDLASRRGITLVEDNAHGLFGRYRGRPLGSFGAFATLSFHETKNVTCGEGGALVVNDARYIERAEIIRDKGTDRGRFFRGEVDKYSWVGLGSSYAISELLAAFLLAQLEERDAVQAARMRIWHRYAERLAEWAEEQSFSLPVVPDQCEHSAHMFFLLAPSHAERQRFIAHLLAHRILAVSHYVPLNVSPKGAEFGGSPGECPVAEDAGERLVRLPLFTSLGDADQERVIEAVLAFQSA